MINGLFTSCNISSIKYTNEKSRTRGLYFKAK